MTKDLKQDELGRPIAVRLNPDLERAIASWIKRQPGRHLSRAEAIRQLLAEALARK